MMQLIVLVIRMHSDFSELRGARSVPIHPTLPVFIPQASASPRPRTPRGSTANPSDQVGRGPIESSDPIRHLLSQV
jgi:hypothetical protein